MKIMLPHDATGKSGPKKPLPDQVRKLRFHTGLSFLASPIPPPVSHPAGDDKLPVGVTRVHDDIIFISVAEEECVTLSPPVVKAVSFHVCIMNSTSGVVSFKRTF